MKAIICIIFKSRQVHAKYGEFLWSEKHKCNIWQGRELELEEFNRVADSVLQINRSDVFPRATVRLVPDAAPKTAAPAELPVEQLIAAYAVRSKEIKTFQLARAREKKAAKRAAVRAPAAAPPVPELSHEESMKAASAFAR